MEVVPIRVLHAGNNIASESFTDRNKLFLIVNPAAGRGRAKELFRVVASRLPDVGASDIAFTQAAGDEAKLAERALASGVGTIVVLGGDGTCARVANVIVQSGLACGLAVIPCGTGNDFAKTLGVERFTVDEISGLLKHPISRPMDVGKADDDYFLNSCGFGFDASVLEATKKVRLLTGDAVYIYSALRQLFTYRGIDVSVDSRARANASKMLMLTVLNGRYLGGAFRIAPDASAIDGELDVGFFSDGNVVERLRVFAGAFRGTHIGLPSVTAERVHKMRLHFSEPPKMEVDGELRQARTSTVEIECVPRVLNVIAAPGFPI